MQPTEPGSLVAFGHSAGQRDCRLFGAVKNLTRKFTADECAALDRNFLGALSIVQSLFEARLPQEIMVKNRNALAGAGLPPIYTETIEPGE